MGEEQNNVPIKPRQKRLKHSNVLITINTNDMISENPNDPIRIEKIDRLRTAVKAVFNEDFLKYYISLRTDHPKYEPGMQIDSNWIHPDKIAIRFAIERGPRSGLLHVHVGVFISHYTVIKYELEKIKEDIKKAMSNVGWSSPYINAVYSQVANIDDALRDYIAKNPIS